MFLAIALGMSRLGWTSQLYFLFHLFPGFTGKPIAKPRKKHLRGKLLTYTKPQVLIIDELGYLPLNRNNANLFFQLVSARYENGSIILTSNKSCIDWWNLFSDVGIAAAVLDCRLPYSKTVKIQEQFYRLSLKCKMGLFEYHENYLFNAKTGELYFPLDT